jgi:signal transduction histidine kinase
VVGLVIAYSYLSLTSDRVERDLQEAHLAAEEASKTKSSFLKMVSHELRTPLATITGITELLTRRGDRSDELPLMLERAARHQQRLIDDLLDSAAIVSGDCDIGIALREFSQSLQ